MNSDHPSLLSRLPRWLDPVLVLWAVAALYWQVRNHGFVELDDPQYVLTNPRVLGGLSWSSFAWAWSSFATGNYHPLTWFSYLSDVWVFGPRPGAMALENALIHAFNSCLVLRLFATLGCSRGGALFGALVFAVHPLNVESVAWISERKTVLAAFFGLVATLEYLRRAKSGRPPVNWVVVVSLALSLLCKAWFVVLPGALLVLDFWPLDRLPASRVARPPAPGVGQQVSWLRLLLREKMPLILLSLCAAALAIASQHAGGALRSLSIMPPGLRLANAITSTCAYLADAVGLGNNSLFYPMPASIPLPRLLFVAAVVSGISTAAIVLSKRCKTLAAGWLWYLLFLLPVIGLVQVGWQARADRYMYLPLVGILWILVSAGERAQQSLRASLRYLLPAGAVLCLVIAGSAAFRQVGLWRNTFGIAGQSIAATGATPRLIGLLGTAHLRAGRWQEALPLLERSSREDAKDLSVAINLAIALFLGGRRSEAVDQAQRILIQNPNYYPAHVNLAHFYRDMGQLELARKQEEIMLQLESGASRVASSPEQPLRSD